MYVYIDAPRPHTQPYQATRSCAILPLECPPKQHTATHCNTLQHTATHCNTLQHTATHFPSRARTNISQSSKNAKRCTLCKCKDLEAHQLFNCWY